MKKAWLPLKRGWEVWKKYEWGGMILLVDLGGMDDFGSMTATTLICQCLLEQMWTTTFMTIEEVLGLGGGITHFRSSRYDMISPKRYAPY